MTPRSLRVAIIALTCAIPLHAFGNAVIVVSVKDAPGEGFLDPTPVAPIGANPGTTIGEQRLIAFQFAADLWGAELDSAVPIVIDASFDPLPCTPTAAVLGGAGTNTIVTDFPGATLPATWHHAALGNRLAGEDLEPETDDMSAIFNASIGTQPGCLTGSGFYLGMDHQPPPGFIDLVPVLLHEFGHGLGFSTFVSRGGLTPPGTEEQGQKDIYETLVRDTATGQFWDQLSAEARAASMVSARQVVLDAPSAVALLPDTLAVGAPQMIVSEPAEIAGEILIGTALFGPQLADHPVAGSLVAVIDSGANPPGTTSDGCDPITNDVGGVIALIDRGVPQTCAFATKVANAQAAGAIAVIIADGSPGSAPADMGGVDPSIVIPSVRVPLLDGARIKVALATAQVVVSLGVDSSRRAGASSDGRPLLYTPDPIAGGSSVSHFDTSAFPHALMEPALNPGIPYAFDMTIPVLRDEGWHADEDLDGVLDADDNCIGVANPDQRDSNRDGIGNACPIVPRLDCVRVGAHGRGTAVFGYDNHDGVDRDIDIGPYNLFVPFPIDRGQPITFESGRAIRAFEVPYQGFLIWVLGDRVAIAPPPIIAPRCR